MSIYDELLIEHYMNGNSNRSAGVFIEGDSMEYFSGDELDDDFFDLNEDGFGAYENENPTLFAFSNHRSSIVSIGNRNEDDVLSTFNRHQTSYTAVRERLLDNNMTVVNAISKDDSIIKHGVKKLNKTVRFVEDAPLFDEKPCVSSTIYDHTYSTSSGCVVYKIQVLE
jgi:hypothetical protein